MLIFPAIDLIGGQAVRLTQGDFARMTVYDSDPCSAARRFAEAGATAVHLVDLEGARDGGTPNFEAVCAIRKATGLFCEIGGGIRSMETVRKYLDAGLDRVILGTAAVENRVFLEEAIAAFGDRIAVVVDPMLATGGSASAAVDFIKQKGGKNIKFMCIIAAPVGLEKLRKDHPDIQIYIGHMDRELNENAYICPGLGDAGDRIFGTK